MAKTSKEKIQLRIDHALTVGQLATVLKDLPDDLPIARLGHFGEIWFLTRYDINPQQGYVTPDTYDWRAEARRNIDVLGVSVPDIGPEPD